MMIANPAAEQRGAGAGEEEQKKKEKRLLIECSFAFSLPVQWVISAIGRSPVCVFVPECLCVGNASESVCVCVFMEKEP